MKPSPAAAVALAACAVLLPAARVVAQETPAQVVERVLANPHGIYKLPPEDQKRLARMKADPQPHVYALKSAYQRTEFTSLAKPAEVLRFERAVTLLGALGHPSAAALLGQWYAAFDEALARRPQDPRVLQPLRLVLDSLDGMKEPDVRDRVLNRLETMDYATRLAALKYLSRSGKGDVKVIDALRRRVADPKSPLYRDKTAQRALRAIETARPH